MLKKHETLTYYAQALEKGELSSASLVAEALQKAKDLKSINAIVSINDVTALKQAKRSDERRRKGNPLSSIDGLPIAIKDNYLTSDYSTSACSNAHPLEKNDIDATAVANLRAAGAVIFAKTNMHEWAFGATNSTSTIGASNNPHNLEHITGGSSGGSAAAVAAGIVAAALGSDTGGSVRIPASACGIYGFKPSYGRASRFGILPLSWSLDAPGPLAASIEDIEMLLPYLLGEDERDSSTINAKRFGDLPEISTAKLVNLSGPGLERSELIDSIIEEALDKSTATVSQDSVAQMTSYFAAWEAILHAEASSYHTELLHKDASGFSKVTRAHLEAGKRLTAVELLKAQKIRKTFRAELLRILGDNDALVLPTLPVPPPHHDETWQEFGGRKVTTQDSMTWFCWLGNLAGLPCLSIPVGYTNKELPVGMMIMGRPNADEHLLAVGAWLDKRINLK